VAARLTRPSKQVAGRRPAPARERARFDTSGNPIDEPVLRLLGGVACVVLIGLMLMGADAVFRRREQQSSSDLLLVAEEQDSDSRARVGEAPSENARRKSSSDVKAASDAAAGGTVTTGADRQASAGGRATAEDGTAPSAPPPPSPTAAIDKTQYAVATVFADGQGSGFVVQRRRWLVTNFHVVQGSNQAKAVGRPAGSGDSFEIEIEGFAACDPGRDLVILVLQHEWPTEPLMLSTHTPRLGEDVFAVGTPIGLAATITRGIVSQMRTAADIQDDSLAPHTKIIQTDAWFAAGSSGGPLCRHDGHVIGINSFGLKREPGGPEFRFAIAAEELAALLERAGDSTRPMSDLPRTRN
jgi:S1-C subfamily serine protease